MPPSGVKKQLIVNYPIPEKLSVVLGDLLYFEKEGLPAGLQNQLIQLAAFQNPEFYKAQAMRRATYNLSRILFCSEEFPKHIGLPRGCLSDVENLFNSLGIEIKIKDERFKGKPLSLVQLSDTGVEMYNNAKVSFEQCSDDLLKPLSNKQVFSLLKLTSSLL